MLSAMRGRRANRRHQGRADQVCLATSTDSALVFSTRVPALNDFVSGWRRKWPGGHQRRYEYGTSATYCSRMWSLDRERFHVCVLGKV